MSPDWVTAFLDFAPAGFGDGVRFWSLLTGYDVSAPRGDGEEFATLVPGEGDPYLRVQRLAEGADRIHLDLHVPDPRAAADRAVTLGAAEVADRGYVELRSPGGFPFCFVPLGESTRPRPTTWPGGHASLLDQVCIDIPASSYDVETRFWSEITGWEEWSSAVSDDFHALVRPARHPLRLLLQRLHDPTGVVSAHLDWATTDRAAEVARHLALGATVIGSFTHWTVLNDPLGREYCVTDRNPETGVLD